MKETVLVKFTFQPGGKEQWLRWCEELNRRSKEVLQTLREEGVTLEACFLAEDGLSVYYLMQAENFNRAKEIAEKSIHPIDIEHKAIRNAALTDRNQLKVLFVFTQEPTNANAR